MSGIDKTNLPPSFDEVYRQYEPNLFTKGEHLRGNDDGSIYLHGLLSVSRKGEQALQERQDKWKTGSENVRLTIDREYGEGVGEKIFQKITNRRTDGRDLGTELLRGDLPLVKEELDRLDKTPFKRELDGNQRLQSQVYGLGTGEIVGRTGGIESKLSEMFGRPLTDDELRGLSGAPEGCGLRLELMPLDSRLHHDVGYGMAGVFVSLPRGGDPTGAFSSLQVTIYRDREGKRHVYQDSMGCNEELKGGQPRPSHLGACAIVKMVDTARTLEVDSIHNFSSQGRNYNGYYTWARCGGDAPIRTVDVREEDRGRYRDFMARLESSTNPEIRTLAAKEDLRVQDFMQTRDGQEFWRTYGFALPLEFDLTDGSPTMQTMESYTVPNSCFELREW